MKYTVTEKDPEGQLDKAFSLARAGDWISVEGRHPTAGAWAFPQQNYCMAADGVTVENKGVIYLSPNAQRTYVDGRGATRFRPDRDFWFRWGNGVKLYGGVYDLNEKAFAGGATPWYCLGMRFMGGACDVDDITIEGLRGTYPNRGAGIASPDAEAFPLSMEGKPQSFTWSRVVVRNSAPDSYCGAIFPGGTVPADPGTVIRVSNCNVDHGKDNWACYSSNVVSSDSSVVPVYFSGCIGRGAHRGFHNDTGPTMTALSNCDFYFSHCGVALAGGTPDQIRNVVLKGCDLHGDCGVIMEGDAQNTVIAVSTDFDGTRFGYAEKPNSRLIVIGGEHPNKPRFQTLQNGSMVYNLSDRRLVVS